MKKSFLFIIIALAFSLSACGGGDVGSGEGAVSPSPSASPAPLSPVEEKLRDMSLEEKVWQLMFVYPEDVSGEKCCTDAELWRSALSTRPVGGIAFLSENFPSEEETCEMMAAIAAAESGVFLGLDEEGGKVARLSYALGVTTKFKPMYEYRGEGRTGAYLNARTIAEEVASFGFNMDFAPVADVWTNEKNTVIGPRAYSCEPEEAAALVSAAVEGFHAGGVISVLKHFPGHGDTDEDSHYLSAHTDKSLGDMRQCEFLPFASGIGAGCRVVMVGHIIAEDIDPENPATLSKKVIDLLRSELGFGGVVITDAFTMEGLGDIDEAEAAVMAIRAGCDMILAPSDPDAAMKAIMENIPEERIDESLRRILELKYEWGIME